jgi:mRNA interferase MazF
LNPRRGDLWWADLGEPRGSEPALRRPVLIVQSDDFNRSRISTVMVVPVTTNLRLAGAPGNVLVRPRGTGLRQPSVLNISQVATLDRLFLLERIGRIPPSLMQEIEAGLRLSLGL